MSRTQDIGELIIALTFVLLLTLEGIEDKMFVPLAVTVVIALLSPLVLSVTAVPVMAAMLMRPPSAKDASHILTRGRRFYRRMERRIIQQRDAQAPALVLQSDKEATI